MAVSSGSIPFVFAGDSSIEKATRVGRGVAAAAGRPLPLKPWDWGGVSPPLPFPFPLLSIFSEQLVLPRGRRPFTTRGCDSAP